MGMGRKEEKETERIGTEEEEEGGGKGREGVFKGKTGCVIVPLMGVMVCLCSWWVMLL